MKMRRFLVPAAMIAAFAACSGAGSDAPPIKIGGAFGTTGDFAGLDIGGSNGAKLAVAELNAAGGLLGRSVVFVGEDTTSTPSLSAKAGERLVTTDGVDAVVGFSDSSVALAGGPPIVNSRHVLVSYGATSPKLPATLGDLAFLACFGDNVQAAAGAEFGIRHFGKTVAVLYDDAEEYTLLLRDYFSKSFTTIGGTVALTRGFDGEATDFSEQIGEVKALAAPPDFLYIAAVPSNVAQIVKQVRAAGISSPIIGGDAYDTPDLVAIAGPASDDVYFTTHAAMTATNGNVRVRTFSASYESSYGHTPENAFAALGYDSVMLLADAMKRAGTTESKALKDALLATRDFPGVTGLISFPNGSHVPKKGVTLIAVRDGVHALAEEFVPDFVPDP